MFILYALRFCLNVELFYCPIILTCQVCILNNAHLNIRSNFGCVCPVRSIKLDNYQNTYQTSCMLTLHCEKTTGKTLYVHIRHLEFIGTFICFGAHDIVFVHYPIGFHINCFVKMSKYI